MTKAKLLNELKKFVSNAVGNYKLPTAIQKEDRELCLRAPETHLMRLPESSSAKKKAPYVIIKVAKGHGKNAESTAVFRMIFCTYNPNEEEGALSLLNVMETVELELLKKVVIGDQFKLDTDVGIESVIYDEDTAPYYAGELVGTFSLPPVEREVTYG